MLGKEANGFWLFYIVKNNRQIGNIAHKNILKF